MDEFSKELDALQVRLRRRVSYADVRYIRNCEIAGRLCTLVGYATAWLLVNPISIILIAIGQLARWAIAHHVLHRAFDNIPGVPRRFHSGHFGRGWRRVLDWNEWMLPAAFQHEHNVHHAFTGAHQDPDVVEANVDFLRSSNNPQWMKYIMAMVIALSWRLTYYAPGTFIQLQRRQKGLRPTRYEFKSMFIFAHIFSPFSREGVRFWGQCILPYAISRFVLVPAMFLAVSRHAAVNVFFSVLAAELLTNLYTFILIASSHTGDDIHLFDTATHGRADFYRHQFLGTVNYKRGPVLRDFLQAWINFQIEHHIFPNLPPSQYPVCAAEVQEICRRHNVPYRSEALRRRVWKMLDIVVGKTTMQRETSGLPAAELVSESAVHAIG